MDLFHNIEYDDLTPDLKLIADVCGIEAVQKIIKHLNGQIFYIPKFTVLKPLILRFILKNSHKTCKELAKELGLSEKYIRDIIAMEYKKKIKNSKMSELNAGS